MTRRSAHTVTDYDHAHDGQPPPCLTGWLGRLPHQSGGTQHTRRRLATCQPPKSLSRLSQVPKPIPAPRRLHSLLKSGWVHLRQPFQLSRSFAPAHESGKSLHVGKRFANGGEAPVETRALNLRLGGPPERTLVIVAFEFEFSDEHVIRCPAVTFALDSEPPALAPSIVP